jgi:hypothetical protein
MNIELSSAIRNRFLFVLIGIALIHASIAAPLMVRCVLADGHTALELLGQDPHRQDHPAHLWSWQLGSGPSPLVYCAIPANDCSDLMFDVSAEFRFESYRKLHVSTLSAGISSAFAFDDIAAHSINLACNTAAENSPHTPAITALRI